MTATTTDATTIGVSPAVREELQRHKERHRVGSFDAVLRALLDLDQREHTRSDGNRTRTRVDDTYSTVWVTGPVRDRLDTIKRERGADSYDEALRMFLGMPPRHHDRERPIDYGPLDG